MSGLVPLATTTTQLPPELEKQFLLWKSLNAPNDSGQDYDLRGAFLHGQTPDQGGHLPDTWKKPEHPTFSTESIYAPLAGDKPPGTWDEAGNFVPGKDKIIPGSILPVGTNQRTGEKVWGEPSELMKGLWDAFTLPGDTLAGKVDPTSSEGIGRAAGFAGNIGLPGLGKSAAEGTLSALAGKDAFDPNQLNMFGGERAKTADIGKLNKAFSLYQKAGKGFNHPDYPIPPQAIEDIFAKTGWFMAPDRKWRFHIPDADAKFTQAIPNTDKEMATEFARLVSLADPNADLAPLIQQARESVAPAVHGNTNRTSEYLRSKGYDYMQAAMQPKWQMQDIIDHPALYDAYPFLKKYNTGLILDPMGKGGGSFNFMTHDTNMEGPTRLRALGTGLHELQHAIQDEEFMGMGGDYPIAQFAMDEVAKQNPNMNMPHVHDVYRALIGETEARVPQTRFMQGPGIGKPEIGGTPYAAQGYDVPAGLQIDPNMINLLGGGAGSQQYLDYIRQQLMGLTQMPGAIPP